MASGPRVANARRRMTSSMGTSEPSNCTATENQSLCFGLVAADHTSARSAINTVTTIPNISSFSHVGTEIDLMPAMLSSATELLPALSICERLLLKPWSYFSSGGRQNQPSCDQL